MADFTITHTITGNVNGRAISVEHTQTIEDITHVIEEAATVAPGSTTRIFQTDAQRRGYHVENAPKFVAFAFQQAGAGKALCTTSGPSAADIMFVGTAPFSIHHGEDFNGNMDSDPGGTPLDPTRDLEAVTMYAQAPVEFRAIALFKPVS